MPASRYTTRLATLVDATFLREMAYEAAAPLGRERPPAEEVLGRPQVAAFFEQWGRPGDHGVLAECDLAPVGAAWFRVFPEDDPEGGFVGGETPEMVVALVPDHRGKGVGGLLVGALLEKAAQEGKTSIGLNVARSNLPAVSLFRRHGFTVLRDREGVLTMHAAIGS